MISTLTVSDLLDDLVMASQRSSRSYSDFRPVADITGAPVRYNSKVGPDSATYQIALPGWDKSEIEVRVDSTYLEIRSSRADSDLASSEGWQVVGVTKSPFKVRFYVGKGATVSSATMKNGLLTIDMARNPSSDWVSINIT